MRSVFTCWMWSNGLFGAEVKPAPLFDVKGLLSSAGTAVIILVFVPAGRPGVATLIAAEKKKSRDYGFSITD